MKMKSLTGHGLKQKVLELLKSKDFNSALTDLYQYPPRKIISPLLSFLYNLDNQIKWRAVSAIGRIVARLADQDMEGARVIMRRLMWNLNDESGGIGWGSPEAMGEILAFHGGLGKEFGKILISYTRVDGNYLEYERLQRGLLWGIGRVSERRPELFKSAETDNILQYLNSTDASVRGHAARVTGLLCINAARKNLERLLEDASEIETCMDGKILKRKVKEMAEDALRSLGTGPEK